jgi:tRNA dimethylallyltransferase
MQQNTLISIVGPTGIGKTALSLAVAKKLNTEIISCDSRQFYQYMDIGTAKATPEEQKAIPHHFLDFLLPDASYNAGMYQKQVDVLLAEKFQTNQHVLLVGGSTLYAHAVWYGIDEIPEVNPTIRTSLNLSFKERGIGHLQEELARVDAISYQTIDIQNPIRLIRALEVYYSSGKPISFYRKQQKIAHHYRSLVFVLDMERAKLYERINERVLEMVENGLEKEVQNLLGLGYAKELPAMRAIGYAEMIAYLEGDMSRAQMIARIQQHSRNYAKRQLTFFRQVKDAIILDASKGIEAMKEKIMLHLQLL